MRRSQSWISIRRNWRHENTGVMINRQRWEQGAVGCGCGAARGARLDQGSRSRCGWIGSGRRGTWGRRRAGEWAGRDGGWWRVRGGASVAKINIFCKDICIIAKQSRVLGGEPLVSNGRLVWLALRTRSLFDGEVGGWLPQTLNKCRQKPTGTSPWVASKIQPAASPRY